MLTVEYLRDGDRMVNRIIPQSSNSASAETPPSQVKTSQGIKQWDPGQKPELNPLH